MTSVVVWHDLECGGYTADLPLWRELAAAVGGPVLDVGAGTGRVALDLVAHGAAVTALDLDEELLAALRERAGATAVETVCADARDFALPGRFALVLAPMQTVQLLGGAAGRGRFLTRAAAHLAPGGRVAVALAGELGAWDAGTAVLPRPDVAEHDGIVLTSQPVRVREDGAGWAIERIRELSAPGVPAARTFDVITLERVGADELEAEAAAAGLAPAGRREIPETEDHVGAEVVILARA